MDPYAFEPELARAATLPASWYHGEGPHRLDLARIFGRTWQFVGHTDQLATPGDYLATFVGEEDVVVVRGEDGVLHAFSNVCRHRAGALALGCGHRKKFQCQYHGWLYDLEGRLLKAPEFEGVKDFDLGVCRQPTFRVDTWGAWVFVNLAPEGPSLAEWLGAIPQETKARGLEHMRPFKTHDFHVACNWKVYVDNYLEGYHIPVAHPGLFGQIDYNGYRTETARWHSQQFAPIKGASPLYERGLAEGQAPEALYYWVFPNLMLNIYPDHVQVNVILPAGPEACITRFLWFYPDPGKPGLEAQWEENFAFSREVQDEDILLCETVQKHLRSAHYHQGRFSPQRENGVHHFHGLVAEYLRGVPDNLK
ncbi:MAG TPA: aromatic ring-hydroxylating dioxygenase subunit alpha [Holophagaceae bacterium]|nr:aromatic ring-hydroxylating dioxygenase subunit alpha [Holophagaceae bacterium]